jgi:hypothetical protein
MYTRPWLKADDQHLVEMAEAGVSRHEMASNLGRSREAVRMRLRRLIARMEADEPS